MVKEEPKVTTTTTTTTTTTAKRGRPRTKPDTTSTIASKAKSAVSSDAPKKRNQKPAKTKTTVGDLDDGDNSSDDEMNIVPVRATAATRSSTRRMATPSSSTSSAAGEPKKRAPRITRKKSEPVAAGIPEQNEVVDDDEDELAELQPVKQKTVKITTTAARKAKAPAVSRTAKAATRVGAPTGTRPSALSSATPGSSILLGKAKTGALKKKVTFLDITEDSDKENQPLLAASKGKSKPETGLTAKPVRRGAAASTKNKQPEESEAKPERKKDPLSPKKATQVAKSGSSGSSDDDEDDVFSTKLPSKSPQRSPVKASSVPPSFASPAKRIDFTQMARPVSQGSAAPEKEATAHNGTVQTLFTNTELGSSPAKRPPPSPFQHIIKESPRKAPLFSNELRPGPDVMGQPKVSPLKASPKKGVGMSFMQPSLDAPLSPTKTRTSPLKTPARRPPSPMKMPPPLPVLEKSPTPVSDPQVYEDIDLQPSYEDSPEIMLYSPAMLGNDVEQGEAEEMDILDISDIQDAEQDELHENKDTMELIADLSKHESSMDDPFLEEVTTPSRRETVLRYDNMDADSSVGSLRSFRGIPPAAPSPPVFETASQQEFVYRDEMIYEDSDVEFESSPTKQQGWRGAGDAESPKLKYKRPERLDTEVGFTPLADRLSQWVASSPKKEESNKYQRRGIFSPDVQDRSRRVSSRVSLEPRRSLRNRGSQVPRESINPIFEDEVPAIEDLSIHTDPSTSLVDESIANSSAYDESIVDSPLRSHSSNTGFGDQISDSSEIYGDENAPPRESTVTINPALFEERYRDGVELTSTVTPEPVCLPMSVTPVRRNPNYPRTIHTVSKVPLKGESDGSLKIPRKRTRSLSSNPTSPTSTLTRSRTLPSPRKNRTPLKTFAPTSPEEDTQSSDFMLPERPKSGTWSGRISPVKSRSPTKGPCSDSGVLQGAVVFVDVHTAEGADASGIFIELLSQMGARCVKSWKWNPRTSLSPIDGAEPRDAPKVGITHVVHKDGGVRTLQKVREANGVVKCVGVGWVLDCERENRWVDEANYAVDIGMIPRGGNKRRKSMEPRALSNQNGTLATLDSSTSSTSSRRSGADVETLQELRRLSPIPHLQPSRRDSINRSAFDHYESEPTEETSRRSQSRPALFEPEEPQTPSGDYGYSFDFDGTVPPSPTTPYYLSEGAKLIQQTCPPKQSRQGLFPVSGNIDEQKDEKLRIRLEAARRKSLVWKPRVGSPLGKGYF
ncbi:uncharacterized protein GIQ15_06224 [Arthroderma uncinatum]|uniref:uncharacterized protein n=1 Tax=Arthroderma uncinatum TaxID=74035 RepID=UPI00144ACB16|nr:uncharacterized protein GIQ15_06224 [Arthroderma uncinatum]KAF3480877.1 hypothetical protein GIQ15_06224 [Arthroderma uncinatum]